MASGPWKGACRAVNVRFDKVSNLEAVVGVVNAGELPLPPSRRGAQLAPRQHVGVAVAGQRVCVQVR